MTSLRELRLLLVGNDAQYFLMHRLALARSLARDGVDLHVALPFERSDERFHGHDFNMHALSLKRGSVNPLHEVATLLELAALSRKLRPLLVHNVTIKPVLYGGVVARALAIPAVVNSVTGLGYVFSSSAANATLMRSLVVPMLRYGSRRSNVTMLFENRDDLETYSTLGISLAEHSRVVPSSGIDPHTFKPRAHAPGPATVMLLGRMLWDKGVSEFVEAARTVRAHRPTTRFVLVGGTDPNPESIPERTLRDWQEEGVVEYWGWRSDVQVVLNSADILCLPSYREGLPRSLLEGAAAGLPLIATDVPGCRDVVRANVSGILVPPRNPSALAAAMMELIGDVQRRARMGAAARADVIARFSVDSVVEATKAVYLETLARAL